MKRSNKQDERASFGALFFLKSHERSAAHDHKATDRHRHADGAVVHPRPGDAALWARAALADHGGFDAHGAAAGRRAGHAVLRRVPGDGPDRAAGVCRVPGGRGRADRPHRRIPPGVSAADSAVRLPLRPVDGPRAAALRLPRGDGACLPDRHGLVLRAVRGGRYRRAGGVRAALPARGCAEDRRGAHSRQRHQSPAEKGRHGIKNRLRNDSGAGFLWG